MESQNYYHESPYQLSLDLFRKNVVCDQINVALCYDRESNLADYDGPLCKDHYGKIMPKPVNGTLNLDRQTASSKMITEAALKIFDSIAHRGLLVRKVTISANRVIPASEAQTEVFHQYSLFDDVEALQEQQKIENAELEREQKIQQVLVSIKERFGKNAIMKAMNYQECATAIERNGQVGGHRA